MGTSGDKDVITGILKLCIRLDQVACRTYGKLAKECVDPELRSFWTEMTREERTHVEYWRHLKALAGELPLAEAFENPGQDLQDLENIAHRIDGLIARHEQAHNNQTAFVLAYRLEFYMLHPAFESLFRLLQLTMPERNPVQEYDDHVRRFSRQLKEHAGESPELELLGETLERMWEEKKKLSTDASIDPLTGVLNRRGFQAISEQLVQLMRRRDLRAGLLMVDVDFFKKINDTHGHAAGDRVLQAVAAAVATSVRAADVVGRYGGEEFVVLLPDVATGTGQQIAERILAAVAGCGPEGIPVTVSIGVAEGEFVEDGVTGLEALIARADAHMYRAKAAGRNRVWSETDNVTDSVADPDQ